jgi:hypothetical protein
MSGAPSRAVSRRAALGALALVACRTSHEARPPLEPAREPLRSESAVDLAPAAGLEWLVEVRCRELMADPITRASIGVVVPDAGFRTFADRRGGLDLRTAEELVVAQYPRSTLALLRARFDPSRVEAAATSGATAVSDRSTERGVVRFSMTVGDHPERVALFEDSLLALERGEPGPLRAAEYFAEGRLRRSLPALHAEPLLAAAALLGPAPLRAFAAGPFEGTWAGGAAGLLGGATAVGASMKPSNQGNGAKPGVAVQIVLLGGWGDDAAAAADRLRAAYGVLAADPLGRLTGLDQPIDGPRASGDAGALRLDVTIDAMALARGLRAATGATLDEIIGS